MDNIKTILCVDDDKLSRLVLQEYIKVLPGQYIAAEAENGKDCLEFVSRHYVDLIILDYYLGDMHGDEVFETISSESINQNVPVVVVSMLDIQDLKNQCIDNNIKNIIQKPYAYEQFEKDVEFVFGNN